MAQLDCPNSSSKLGPWQLVINGWGLGAGKRKTGISSCIISKDEIALFHM